MEHRARSMVDLAASLRLAHQALHGSCPGTLTFQLTFEHQSGDGSKEHKAQCKPRHRWRGSGRRTWMMDVCALRLRAEFRVASLAKSPTPATGSAPQSLADLGQRGALLIRKAQQSWPMCPEDLILRDKIFDRIQGRLQVF